MAEYTGTPVYLAIAEKIRDRILSGEYPPGSMLPSDRTLMDQHGVSRHVLTSAWGLLVSEGLVLGHQGRGRFVRKPPAREPYSVDRPLIEGSTKVTVDVTARPALPTERQEWSLPLGVAVLVITHSWLAEDGSTVEVEETVLPADRYKVRLGEVP